jgi:UDP-N-acetylmuramyl pentapeptide phosphotransferase/UDP-N-acetylglucosamine-1-phosphate transferase
LIVLFFLANFNNLILDFEFIEKAIICLSILFFLNIFGVLFVGDNGAYLISILVGYILIKFSNENFIVSPYFIVILLWYPAYENLFSILRKKIKKFDAFEADNKHIHQIIFKSIQKKTKLTKFYCNNITSMIINLFNIFIFYFAFINFSHTKNLILILILSLFTYSFVYFYLRKKNY